MVSLDIDLTWLLPLILIVISLMAALGAWFAPQRAEHRTKQRELKEKIKRQILELETPFSEVNEEDIEKDWRAIGQDVVKPLKRELKTTQYERTRRTIMRALYHLGDKETRTAIFSEYKEVLKNSKDSDKIREMLERIKYFKIMELGPLLFDRLKIEKIEKYEMIRTISELEYSPALSYLINLADERLKQGKPNDHILHACVMAIGNIAPNWNELTNEEFHRIISVFTEALKIQDDRWLTDAIVRCELPLILKCKQELHEPFKTELIKTLAKLMEHKDSDIRENAVERLTQLGDKRAVPYLRKLLDQEKSSSTTLKTRLEWSLKVLEQ